jgi:thioesterase III
MSCRTLSPEEPADIKGNLKVGTEIKIRGYHTDSYKHVNNARYLEFMEEGRWQLLEEYWNLEEFMNLGFQFFAVNISISYKNPAKVNDTVIVRSGLGKIGNKSAVIRQQILNKASGKVCTDADVTFVIADSSGKPVKLEGEVKDMLLQIPLFEE